MTGKTGNSFSNLSIKTKTLAFIILVTGVPAWLLATFLLSSFSQASADVEAKALTETTALIRQQLLDNVSAKAKIYDVTFENVIIGLGAIKDSWTDAATGQKALDDFRNRNHVVAAAYFVPASALDGASPAFPGGFAFVEDGRKVFTGRWFGPYREAHATSEAMVYGLPIWDGGTLQGVLAFDITVSTLLNDVIDIDPAQSSYVMIVRNDGQVITAAKDFQTDFAVPASSSMDILSSAYADKLGLQAIATGHEDLRGSFELPVQAGGSSKIGVYANVPSFGAKIFVVAPLDQLLQVQKEKAAEISASVQRIALLGLLALLGLAAIIGLAVYTFSENVVVRPLQRLMKGVISLEKADFKSGADVPVSSADEIGSLASRFNAMSERLRESYEGLERKVEERTAEISKNLSEIQRLNKFMIGREKRMSELKKEIAELKGAPAPK